MLQRGVFYIGVLGLWKHFGMHWYGRFKTGCSNEVEWFFFFFFAAGLGLDAWDF